RLDLEHTRALGRPRSLAHYQQEFPVLFADRASLQAITFEDYRLRREAGEDPQPADYLLRYGVNPADGPVPPTARPQPRSEAPDHHRTDDDLPLPFAFGSTDLDSWRGSRGGPRQFQPDAGADNADGTLRLAGDAALLPTAGSDFAGFHLEAELGRGAFSRVFR